MDLICYLHPGWAPLIRPAPATRAWMDETPESFAYRCLPLNIANAHGWEVLSPCGFDAIWNGEAGVDAITIRPEQGAKPERIPVSLFGQGVITFHIEAIFRTPEGWDLWVGGSPNRAKDGISPLTAIVETDWSPFTFTMNWRFTRPGQWIHFDALEPICFLFPIQRAAIEAFTPKFEPLDADPATMERFRAWSRARDEFHQRMATDPPRAPADRWQKHYYRGVDAGGESIAKDHRAKLRLRRFDSSATPDLPAAPDDDAPPQTAAPVSSNTPHAASEENDALRLALAKREWLLETLERQRDLAPGLTIIERRSGLSTEEFLARYYAVNRPRDPDGRNGGLAGPGALDAGIPQDRHRRPADRIPGRPHARPAIRDEQGRPPPGSALRCFHRPESCGPAPETTPISPPTIRSAMPRSYRPCMEISAFWTSFSTARPPFPTG